MIRSCSLVFVASVACAQSNAADSFNVNDCIINGMKGVSSDTAARQVRYACDQKKYEFKAQRLEALSKEFGEPVEIETLEADKNFDLEGPGRYSTSLTNKSPERVVTFVRLEVTPAPGGAGTVCDTEKRRVYTYQIALKPRASIKLVYPSSVPYHCIRPVLALGRAPSWKDVSFSSSASPSEKDPFAGLE